MKNTLMIAVVAAVLIGASVGLTVYLTAGGDSAQAQETPAAGDESTEAAADEPEKALVPAIYEPLEPQFVVNFAHNGVLRYLQVSVSVMTRSEDVVTQIRHHMPAIRHGVVALLSSRNYDQLGSVEGKDELRALIRDEIQSLVSTTDAGDGVEEVYLTGFVMQ